MKMTRRSLMACLLAVFLGLPATSIQVHAQQGLAGDASRFVETLADRAITTLTGGTLSPTERDRKFRAILNEAFDVPAIGRFVLGRYWQRASEAERAEYLRLFEDLIVRTYAGYFSDYGGETLKIIGVQTQGSDAIVQSEIVRPNGPPLRIDWRVKQSGDSLKIVDVAVEGVSMAITQRSEFASVIQRDNGRLGGLIAALRNKTTLDTPVSQE